MCNENEDITMYIVLFLWFRLVWFNVELYMKKTS
jgi:hypothetical protein